MCVLRKELNGLFQLHCGGEVKVQLCIFVLPLQNSSKPEVSLLKNMMLSYSSIFAGAVAGANPPVNKAALLLNL